MKTVEKIGEYSIIKKIGEGSFGVVYQAQKQNHRYAIKTQSLSNIKQMLLLEYQILSQLNKSVRLSQSNDFPKVYEYIEMEHFSFLVMQKLGLSLHEWAIQIKNEISLDTILKIMFATLKSIEQVHRIGYIYRDVKPANFMLREKQGAISQIDQTKLLMIDMGLCKKYRKSTENDHIPMKEGRKLIGTAIFSSLNAHRGLELSRRDDLLSWIYMIVYLVKRLPWEELAVSTDNKDQKSKELTYAKIWQIKEKFNFDVLLNDEKLPKCISKIKKMVDSLEFQQTPNYSQIYFLIEEQYIKYVGKCVMVNQEFSLKQKMNSFKQTESIKSDKKIKINFKAPIKKILEVNTTDSEQNKAILN